MPEQFVVKKLEEKYQKQFIIRSSNFSAETGNYHLKVSPADNESLVFEVDHNPQKKNVNDYYPYALWQQEAQAYMTGIIKKEDVLFALSTGVRCSKEPDPLNIDPFEKILDDNPEILNLNIFLHLFGEINDTSLQTIIHLDETLRSKNINKVGFTVSFYSKESIEGEKLEELNFGFNAQSPESFETTHTDDFLGLIKYRIDTSVSKSPSEEQLKDIVSDNPDLMLFKKL